MTKFSTFLMALIFLNFCQAPKPRECTEGNCKNGFGQRIIEGEKRMDGTRTYVIYKGNFVNGLKHGKGILDLRTAEGDYYEGELPTIDTTAMAFGNG